MRTVAYWLSLILIFLIPCEEIITVPGLGTISHLAGFFVAAFWALTVAVTGGFRKSRPFHVIVYLFVLWNAVSLFWSIDIEGTLTAIQTYFQQAILVFLLWDLYTTPAAVRTGLQAYVLGAYVSVFSTVANYLTGTEAGYLRYSATGYHPNTIGLVLALGIPVAWHLAVSEEDFKRTQLLSLVNYAYIPAAIFAISLTATRFAMLAALPAFVFGIGTFSRLKPFSRVLIFVVLAGALFTLPSLIPQSSLERLATTTDEISTGDLNGRIAIWRQGFAAFSEHPLLGIGSGAFATAVSSHRSAHNSFLVVLTQIGIVGFALFTIILATSVYYATRRPKWESRFWLTLLLVWFVGNFALTWLHKKQTWLFLSLVVASANLPTNIAEPGRQLDFPSGSTVLAGGERDEAYDATP